MKVEIYINKNGRLEVEIIRNGKLYFGQVWKDSGDVTF